MSVHLLRSVWPRIREENDLDEAVTWPGLSAAPLVAVGELRRLQRARLALHRCGLLCGRHFGPALLLAAASNFVMIVTLSYGVVMTRAMKQNSLLLSLLSSWLLFVLGNLLLTCWACSSASHRAVRVTLLLYKVETLLRRSDACDTFRLEVEPLHFSAAGFFNISLSLFMSIVSAAVTYLIVILQIPR
ncbi:putative gustatory receptor 2a [Schistocerca americana]|uniref:putative gustatory receptor 2a n=1 Tax=Schistocerca americana TaxID=7009 RepID=UPI001F4FF2F6|nr:putative gustatory receptor 2a [Schistocerca americana]